MSISDTGGHPFDAAAPGYDVVFTNTKLGRWLRNAVRQRLSAIFRPGDRILDLGCGTGEDAIWLAQQGMQVLATDASPSMLAIGRGKAEAANVLDMASFRKLDLASLKDDDWATGVTFDGVLSNFGALNCLPDRRYLARELGCHVRSGGSVVLVVMGPFCLWELVWYLLHRKPGEALRRLRSGRLAHAGGDGQLPVWYPSPRRLRAEFACCFRHRQTVGIGAMLPPTYLGYLVDRWPRLFSILAWSDRHIGGVFPWMWLSDHYLSVFERR
ncbi:MAG: class I SAM-dependent methyltransferase [Dehalococcoidia bacterium]|nr:class I SAM-dependent methyltransferase [Dehalococcoidia bacterium]